MNNLRIINGYLLNENSFEENEFEKLYISLREKEGRIFTEKEIRKLPKFQNLIRILKNGKSGKNPVINF